MSTEQDKRNRQYFIFETENRINSDTQCLDASLNKTLRGNMQLIRHLNSQKSSQV